MMAVDDVLVTTRFWNLDFPSASGTVVVAHRLLPHPSENLAAEQTMGETLARCQCNRRKMLLSRQQRRAANDHNGTVGDIV